MSLSIINLCLIAVIFYKLSRHHKAFKKVLTLIFNEISRLINLRESDIKLMQEIKDSGKLNKELTEKLQMNIAIGKSNIIILRNAIKTLNFTGNGIK